MADASAAFGVLQRGGIVMADPATAQIVRQWEAELAPQTQFRAVATAGDQVVALLTSSGRHAPARLAVIDAAAVLRTVEIPGIVSSDPTS